MRPALWDVERGGEAGSVALRLAMFMEPADAVDSAEKDPPQPPASPLPASECPEGVRVTGSAKAALPKA